MLPRESGPPGWAGVALGAVASCFHAAMSAAAVKALVCAASEEASELIVLSGVFQRDRHEELHALLADDGEVSG
jgi:hypothetical protein